MFVALRHLKDQEIEANEVKAVKASNLRILVKVAWLTVANDVIVSSVTSTKRTKKEGED